MPDSSLLQNAVDRLVAASREKKAPFLVAGADGFADEIIQVVDKRFDAESYQPIRTISEYAARLAEAAGKSTNVEFVVRQVKSGGNGPLMSEAFGRLGGRIRYVGSVGWPEVDPLFDHLREYGDVRTIAPVAVTLATEFEDGKIMHGKHQPLREVTWPNFLKGIGGEEELDRSLREADLMALVNWTMLPYLNDVIRGVLARVSALGSEAPQFFFFDLCDPEKRTTEDLVDALSLMGQFANHVENVILGLNEKESHEVCKAYGVEPGTADHAGLISRAERLARKIGVTEIVIHPTRYAAAWNRDAQGAIDGPFCPNPRLTTGAGDHFNGGYMYARVLGLNPAEAVIAGKCVSGFYVREARGPSAGEIALFAKRWIEGNLDPWEDVGG